MTDDGNNNNNSSLTWKQRLEKDAAVGLKNLKGAVTGRKQVKEEIVQAFELHKAAETLKLVLKEDRVASNPILRNELQQSVESKKNKIQEILDTPPSLLTAVEVNFLKLTKYQIQNDEKDIVKVRGDYHLSNWIGKKRGNIFGMEEGKLYTNKKSKRTESHVAALREDMKWLKRLNVNVNRVAIVQKTFEDHIQDLITFKEKHGHLKVPQIYDEGGCKLGDWVKRMRKEYDYHQDGRMNCNGHKVSTLTPQKIARLDEIGFLWRIRQARPKKGDPRYRLRRKSDQNAQSPTTTAAVAASAQVSASSNCSSNDEPTTASSEKESASAALDEMDEAEAELAEELLHP